MASFLFTIFVFSLIFLSPQAHNHGDFTRCSNGGPDIHYPFHLNDQKPHHPSNRSFQLHCNNNTTLIHFPSYGDLVVKSISYDTKKLDLLDPKSCVHEVFLNLNLSLSPFLYYYVVKNYTYLNCSSPLSFGFVEVPCLSRFGHFVYTVEPSMEVPKSCKAIKTVAIPFQYSPFLSDSSFGLGLTWEFLGGQDCSLWSKIGEFSIGYVQALGICICIFAVVAALLSKKLYHSKILDYHKESEKYQVEAEKFLGYYKAFSTHEADVEQASNHC
ncbi:hypothetical protein UlMin_001584 [Ulmus minor]